MTSGVRYLAATTIIGLSAWAFTAPSGASGLGGAVGGVGGAVGDTSASVGASVGGGTASAAAIASVGKAKAVATIKLRKKIFSKYVTSKTNVGVVIDKSTKVKGTALSSDIALNLALRSRTGRSISPSGGTTTARAIGRFHDLSSQDQHRLIKKCSTVLAGPSRYDSDLVALCRIIASLDVPQKPNEAKRSKKRVVASTPLRKKTVAESPQETKRSNKLYMAPKLNPSVVCESGAIALDGKCQ